MKKILIILLTTVTILVLGYVLYSAPYTIKDNKDDLSNSILNFNNINKRTPFKVININQELDIDNKKYVLCSVDDSLSFTELSKGINNKYKIEYTEDGLTLCSCTVTQTNKAKYLLLRLSNINTEIKYAKILLDNTEYTIDFPKNSYMTYCKLTSNTEATHLETENIRFFNDDDVEITDKIFETLF